MKKLMPILIAVMGLAGGLVGGAMMKPDAMAGDAHAEAGDGDHAKPAKAAKAGHGGAHDDHAGGGHAEGAAKADMVYVGLKKPFFAPVLRNGDRHTLVRLDIHLEVPADMEGAIEKHEPKLRDGFLRAVMNFAHEGGFARVHGSDGFEILSDDLLLSARDILGDGVKRVLIGEILTRES